MCGEINLSHSRLIVEKKAAFILRGVYNKPCLLILTDLVVPHDDLTHSAKLGSVLEFIWELFIVGV